MEEGRKEMERDQYRINDDLNLTRTASEMGKATTALLMEGAT
jgi:hypothetical protein